MNHLLSQRFHSLDSDRKTQLRRVLQDSPMALRLLDFLQQTKKEKPSTLEIVQFVYGPATAELPLNVQQNRFFKLRKKVLELMDHADEQGESVEGVLPLERRLFHSRELVNDNFFEQAQKELSALVADLWSANVFEWLPEALHLQVICKRALNVKEALSTLLTDLENAAQLQFEFRRMQAMGGRLFEATMAQNSELAQKEFAKMSSVSQRFSQYPRFALVYHLAAVNNMPFWAGYSSRAHMRHINAMKRIVETQPEMPGNTFERNTGPILRYYIAMALSTASMYKGEIQEAHAQAVIAWDILSKTPNMRLKKTETHYHNKASIEVTVGKYRDAIQTMEELIEFLKVQNQDARRLQAYSKLATTYTYAYPNILCPDPQFLLNRLEDYIALMRQQHAPQISEALCTKAIFYRMNGRHDEAKSIALLPETAPIFDVPGFGMFKDLLTLGQNPSDAERQRVIRIFEHEIRTSDRGDVIESCKRGLRLLGSESHVKP
ncbi:MAG: hypothetical protein KA239_03680 [Bacteroidia bacterium]|nr:hypothetical protein [Bacteroidia bacterium]